MSDPGTAVSPRRAVRGAFLIVAAALLAAACSGGSGPSGDPAGAAPPPTATTGTLGILLTDAPADEFSAINVTVTDFILLGEDGGDDQVLFSGEKEVNLLDLASFNEPVSFTEVDIGRYHKLRMYISGLELVPHAGDPIYPALPANGKIDLLDQDGFDILPEQTLLAEVDIDANKSIKVTGTGNGKYQFRPVVKVQFSLDGNLPDNLARVEGIVAEIEDDGDETEIEICAIDNDDNCIDIVVDDDTSYFGDDGMPAGFGDIELGQTIVAIGRYVVEEDDDDEAEGDDMDDGADIDVELNAIIVEIGGNSSQVRGQVVSEPDEGVFLIVESGDDETSGDQLAIELQDGTRVFDDMMEVDDSAITIGSGVDAEGVLVTPEGEESPSSLLAAILFVAPPEGDLLSGEVAADSVDTGMMTFDVTNTDGTTCVELGEGAEVIDVNTATSEVTSGAEFAVITGGKMVDVFGTAASEPDACFVADEIIVETTEAP